MQSAKSIMFSSIKRYSAKIICTTLLFSAFQANAQNNSPYSRYGLGDLVPTTNVVNRAMGNISVAYSDFLTSNFNNPASYSSFRTFLEDKSKKPVSGRVLLDAGINIESRTLRNPNQPEKFSSTYANFSYLQLGIPLRNNWGLSFGLRPVSKIKYKVSRRELLFENELNDSAYTEFDGEGGTFLPTIGTGFAIKNLSLGVNMGYMFGNKEFSSTRSVFNDSAVYNTSKHSTSSSFGDLFFNAGAQYLVKLSKQTSLRLGLAGNWKQNLGATQDITVQTVVPNANIGVAIQDSVYEQKGIKGDIVFPSSYTAGFVLQRTKAKGDGWLLGAELMQSKWSEYRFFGQVDSVQDSWQFRVGGQIRPEPTRNYFSNVTYRAGFYFGPDYVNVGSDLPQYGITFGLGLPIAPSRLSPYQYTIINLALEYAKRGNNDNSLKENLFKISLGLNFSDLWFNKRRYE
ncbi:hypothetical protein OCK74_04770 [Chitinophagaceae bacterium LB-8]|uniref:Uncharacterized protein n=1 Tax=Paraflavisolibacter caeni TaxID=2982496 RepID=A0A9X2XNJ9_9BACT|nr:hypothetical protein [Paraflavisolibacter caeni]MCU7548414.1 hypothetical protein [Paraflavisolibacter caeni]